MTLLSSETDTVLIYIAAAIFGFAVYVMIMRSVFSIDTIVDQLKRQTEQNDEIIKLLSGKSDATTKNEQS
mgnify:CR=1 FL=1